MSYRTKERLTNQWKGKCVYTQELEVYPSQGKAENDIHDRPARSKERLTKQWEGKGGYQIKQNNGKENVFKHIFQGYILPKDKQNIIHDRI